MSRSSWFLASTFAAMLAAPFGCADSEATAASQGAGGGAGGLPLSCPERFADCDGEASNGCEATLDTSALNCGACGVACSAENAAALCSAGKCIAVCDVSFANCDGDDSNGCEVSTITDPSHCGSCSQSCSASCAYSACDVTVIASGESSPVLLAVDEDAVYWTNQGSALSPTGSVVRAPKGGGAPVVIAESQAVPIGVAVDATSVYWTSLGTSAGSGAVMMAPKEGGGPITTLAEGQASPFPIEVDGDWLYWANRGSQPDFKDGAIMRLSLTSAGAAPEVVLPVPGGPNSLCVGEDAIYFTVPGSGDKPDGSLSALAKSNIPGGPATIVGGELKAPGGVVCLPAGVYVRTSTSILAYPVAGGAPKEIIGAMTEPALRMASDGASLYWTAASPSIQKVEAAALDGSSRRILASAQTNIIDVAVDATGIYWTRVATSPDPSTGVVLKVLK